MALPLALTLACLSVALAVDDSQLVLVQAIWNSGEHTPLKVIRTDPVNTEATWHGGMASLTPIGAEENSELGKLLRQRYVNEMRYISEGTSKQVYFRSGDQNLTLQAAYATVFGFLGDSRHPAWLPAPVHSDPRDRNLCWQDRCEAADVRARTRLFTSPWFLDQTNLFLIRESISRSGNGQFDDLMELYYLWDSLHSMKRNERGMPHWVSEARYYSLKSLLDTGAAVSFADTKVARLRGGPLLMEILSRIEAKTRCARLSDSQQSSQQLRDCQWDNELKFYGYSADHLTLYALLAALGAAPAELPQAASAVIVELWRTPRGQYQVMVLQKTSASEGRFRDTLVGGCDDVVCALDVFRLRSQQYLPINWHAECTGRVRDFSPDRRKLEARCGSERDKSDSKNCRDWAEVNYCVEDFAVRFIYCRHTCLCDPKFARRRV